MTDTRPSLTDLVLEAEKRDLYFMLENKFRLDEQYRYTAVVSKRNEPDAEHTGGGSNDSIEDALDKAIANWDGRQGGV